MTEETLFHEALVKPPAVRAAFLDQACAGQPNLRAAVEALLAAHDASGNVLDRPAAPMVTGQVIPESDAGPPSPATSAYQSTVEKAGAVIAGRYILVERIGEGGMGEVWVAKQTEPVKRKVALKLIKAGMDSKAVLQRFDSERQALALMDHPHISKVLDGGLTADRRPFFVMELVNGLPLTKFCDEAKLTPRQRLELFVPICQAVQHAHHKGIVHRDLKPSNILVTIIDGRPVPKIIDFGVAKAVGGKLTDESLSTQFGAVVGTLEYMSPEQAGFSGHDIDTRADIYSLGVVLYELLTGLRPIDAVRLRNAAYTEMIRIIQQEEPSKPSTRLSTDHSLPSLAALRQTDPKRLMAMLRGELDWVVMKCLEKDRNRRYETANGLARDIQRYLADEAVEARPPTAGYRLGKFLRRNKRPAAAAAAVVLVLVGGIVSTTWGLVRAEQSRRLAEDARAAEAEQRDRAEVEKVKAEKAEADTLADYRASTDDAIEQLIGSKQELGPQEKAYLENTLERWQVFAQRSGDDKRSLAIRAEGQNRVAHLWQKLGRNEAARAGHETALQLWKKLVEQFPAMPEYQSNLANTHISLGLLLAELGKSEPARAEYLAARDNLTRLVDQFPAVPEFRQGLASAHTQLGNLLDTLGKTEAALAEYHASLELGKKLVDQYPNVPAYRRDLAASHSNLGLLHNALGQHEAARTQIQAARAIFTKLVEQYPAVPKYQQYLAASHFNLGVALIRLEELEAARAEIQVARDLLKKLVKQFPSVPVYREDLADAHHNLGVLLRSLGQREAARVDYQSARDLKEKLVEQFPSVPKYRLGLADAHATLGVLLADLGKREEARAEWAPARGLLKNLVEQFPAVPEFQISLGNFYQNYGVTLREDGKLAESVEYFDLAIQTLRSVQEKQPHNTATRHFLRNSHWHRARSYHRLQKFTEAIQDWDRAIELSTPAEQLEARANRATTRVHAGLVIESVAEVAELTKSLNWNAGQWYDFACIYSVASGKIADKNLEYADRAMELLQKAVQAGNKNVAHMKKDSDLDPLRERGDFKKLIAELEAKAAPKP